MRLAKALGTTPEFWINGEIAVELYRAEHDAEQIRGAKITPIPCGPIVTLTLTAELSM